MIWYCGQKNLKNGKVNKMTRLKVSKETEKYLKETGSQVLYDLFHYLNGKLILRGGNEAFKELEEVNKDLTDLVYKILTGKVTVYSSGKYVLIRNIVTEDYGDGLRDIAPLYWCEDMPTMEYESAQVLDEDKNRGDIAILTHQGWEKKEVYNY